MIRRGEVVEEQGNDSFFLKPYEGFRLSIGQVVD
jgi:hypothetical protein